VLKKKFLSSLSLSLIFTLLLIPSPFLFAEESLTITTYYPSPYGVYRELRSQRMAIGDNYISGSEYCWEGSCTNTINADADLVVQGNVGIGTTNPGSNKLSMLSSGSALAQIRTTGSSTDVAQLTLMNNANNLAWISLNGSGQPNFGGPNALDIMTNPDHPIAFNQGSPTPTMIMVSGKVGIGTTSPAGKLDVNGTIYQRGAVLHADYVFEPGYKLESIDEHSAFMWKYKHLKAVPKAKVDEKGQEMVEIGANNRGILEELEKAHVYIYQLNEKIKQLEVRISQLSTAALPVASDARLKKDIRLYTNGLKIIKRINPVWFKYNGKAGFPNDDKDNHIGVIAQEVIKVAPYTINTFKAKLNPEDKEPTELLNFNSHALTFDLVNSVKELDSNITKLSQENQGLRKSNKELKSELENMKTRLSRLEAKAK
jgi:hypothetical protein